MAGKGQPFQTQEKFIEKSEMAHKGSLDYSRIVYRHSKQKVEFGCKVCGHWFMQTPNHNLTGRGCPDCGWKRQAEKMRHTHDEFVTLAEKLHGDKYDYSKTEYVKGENRLLIKCKAHNTVFIQTGAMHLKGHGCPSCYDDRRGDAKITAAANSFVKDAEDLHGVGKYDYSEVIYRNSESKVVIGCTRCGEAFEMTPSGHKQGYGCQPCAAVTRGINKRSNTEEFVQKSQAVHGLDKFRYDRVDYKTSLEPVNIGCTSCGNYWSVKATKHLAGVGCAVCADYGFDPSTQATLYVLKHNDITKVGVTNRDVKVRAKEVSKDSGYLFSIENTFIFERGSDCLEIEAQVLDYLKINYQNPLLKYNGYTESFLYVDYIDLISKIKEKIHDKKG